jgi:hypothetical protein
MYPGVIVLPHRGQLIRFISSEFTKAAMALFLAEREGEKNVTETFFFSGGGNSPAGDFSV